MRNHEFYENKVHEQLKPIMMWMDDLFSGRTTHSQPTKENPITTKQLIEIIKTSFTAPSFKSQHIRVIVHHLRFNSGVAILSNNTGYYTSTDKEEIKQVIDSLHARAEGIKQAAHALTRFI